MRYTVLKQQEKEKRIQNKMAPVHSVIHAQGFDVSAAYTPAETTACTIVTENKCVYNLGL